MLQHHALIIGNSEYEDRTFEHLKYARKDAEDVYAVLTAPSLGIFSPGTSRCLPDLTLDTLREQLRSFFNPVQPEDLVLIYFAGHAEKLGNNQLFLIMKDSEKGSLASSAFKVEDFIPYFEEKQLKRYIVVLDCCRAGQAFHSPGVKERGALEPYDPQGFTGIGKVFIAAASRYQLARESDALGHGFFSHYFIQGIKDGAAAEPSAPFIETGKLCAYIQQQISANHSETSQDIRISAQDVIGDMDLARNPRYLQKQDVKIDIVSLPDTGPDLFGRERELAMLDAAWEDPQVCIVTLIAWGGVGKSTLMNKWLLNMKEQNYRGAQRVFGWSFYSQGAAEGKQASADRFFEEALGFFGDPEPDAGDPDAKARRLANLIQGQKSLLLLDGLEPLQYPPKLKEQDGLLKDQALCRLLKDLASQNPGLCIISSRLAVNDLRTFFGTSVHNTELNRLPEKAGVKLLKKLGVEGAENDLKSAVNDFKGHALALTLLGTYLKVIHEGDIRKRDLIPQLRAEEQFGGHARRVMESYEHWFRSNAESKKSPNVVSALIRKIVPEKRQGYTCPELNLLYIMGLFDRPADMAAIEAVAVPPIIKGLTEGLQDLSHKKWQETIAHL